MIRAINRCFAPTVCHKLLLRDFFAVLKFNYVEYSVECRRHRLEIFLL